MTFYRIGFEISIYDYLKCYDDSVAHLEDSAEDLKKIIDSVVRKIIREKMLKR